MKRFLLILICIFVASVTIAQESDNPFLGEWKVEWINWNNEKIDGGSMVFFEDMHCEISNMGETRHYDYNIVEEPLLMFIASLGYYWEYVDEEHNLIKLTPAHESDVKWIYLTRV